MSGRRRLMAGLVLCALTLVVAALNFGRGAFDSGLGSYDDEPSHVVTSLMFRDFFAQGLSGSPREFAEDYYVHYPKVALGQWPPVYYVLQGLWLLALGDSAAAAVLLSCLLTALTAFVLHGYLRDDLELPARVALAFALGFCLLPLVQEFSALVMTEMPLALLCLLATRAFGRYLASERARDVLGFAAWSTLAILTKGSGLALGLLPPIAIVLSGRHRIWRRPSLWAAALLVALACGPWFVFTLPIAVSTWAGGTEPSLAFAARAIPFYLGAVLTLGGLAVALAAVTGLCVRPPSGPRRARWASIAALAASLAALHCCVPSSIEERHLVLLAPAWMALAAWGVHAVATRSAGRWRTILPLCVPLLMLIERFELPVRDNQGYRQAAAELVADPELAGSVFLVASDAIGEGLFVAGVALNEERPGHVVLRASKVLGHSSWTGSDYRPAFTSSQAMLEYLQEVPVGVIVFDRACDPAYWFEHHDRLQDLVEERPDVWELVGVRDVVRDGVVSEGALRLYRQVGHETRPRRPIELESVLGRELPSF